MLTDLIVSSVKDVINEYQSSGHDVPSLFSTETGPFDAPHLTSPKLSKAVQIIEASCAQLTYTVANPGHVVTNVRTDFEEPVAFQLVINAKIADILAGKPDGLHIEQLAKEAGLDPNKLGRILRMLATKHCFQEVKPNVFANNRLSMKLVSTDPVAGLAGNLSGETIKAAVRMSETLLDPKTGFSTSADDSPFHRAHGVSIFNYYDTRFAQAMVGWGEVTGRAMLPQSYEWDKVPSDSVVCDIGGGNGHATLGLVKKFPHLKIILQDLAAVVQQGREYWQIEHPNAIANKRVDFVAIDFFNGQPVAECDYYYLRHVLHDWPTSDCLKILAGIRKSMGPSSRLLIHELVLQHVVRDPSIPNQAPEPLLANYGMARIRAYNQDINMLNSCNSQERTLQEFIDMGLRTGFRFERLWDAGEAGLVEFTIS
ncbi:S-adenosyl-L-methionine-dependent methyltransferase [Pholiota conissans]|uniref:S-adenosyl-L-methionine-dependent methyltransferase n=1 Tax=Pholiota conissans TaxID=109636 RepID=A0A9P6D1B9_9AGAR|nr:S-adenosyl-L-methionine-dependent methyltransferase [Pholiota conissans]